MNSRVDINEIIALWRKDIPGAVEAFQPLLALMAAADLGIIEGLLTNTLSVEMIEHRYGMAGSNLIKILQSLGIFSHEDTIATALPGDKSALFCAKHHLEFESFLRHKRHVYKAMLSISDVIEDKSDPIVLRREMELCDYIRAMHFIALRRNIDISKHINLTNIHSVIDAGCGSGFYTQRLLEKFTKMTATLVDFPKVLSFAKEYTYKAGVDSRTAFISCDLLKSAPPVRAPHDLALLFSVLHQYDYEENVKLLKNLRQSLASSARLIICEYVDSENSLDPIHAAFSLLMLAVTEGGKIYTDTEIYNMLIDSGFNAPEFIDICKEGLVFVYTQKTDGEINA